MIKTGVAVGLAERPRLPGLPAAIAAGLSDLTAELTTALTAGLTGIPELLDGLDPGIPALLGLSRLAARQAIGLTAGLTTARTRLQRLWQLLIQLTATSKTDYMEYQNLLN